MTVQDMKDRNVSVGCVKQRADKTQLYVTLIGFNQEMTMMSGTCASLQDEVEGG